MLPAATAVKSKVNGSSSALVTSAEVGKHGDEPIASWTELHAAASKPGATMKDWSGKIRGMCELPGVGCPCFVKHAAIRSPHVHFCAGCGCDERAHEERKGGTELQR